MEFRVKCSSGHDMIVLMIVVHISICTYCNNNVTSVAVPGAVLYIRKNNVYSNKDCNLQFNINQQMNYITTVVIHRLRFILLLTTTGTPLLQLCSFVQYPRPINYFYLPLSAAIPFLRCKLLLQLNQKL